MTSTLKLLRGFFFGSKGKDDLAMYNPSAGGRGDTAVDLDTARICRVCTPYTKCVNCVLLEGQGPMFQSVECYLPTADYVYIPLGKKRKCM